MFSKLLIFGLATAVYGQGKSACLEDGHPDNDCCALPGHMSCSGGNRLKQSEHVCWKGSYEGKQSTAYSYACYPTQAPIGHDPSKCKEDGKKDDDCCALKGHESCATGFRVQRSNHACFKDPQFTAYNYFCTPKGGNNDALCKPNLCTSPGPNGQHDCWAGNGEPFTCGGGYSPKMTGKRTQYNKKTYKEYTCCPGRLANCVTNACTSPDGGGEGGTDCWAGNGEPFTCKTGFIPRLTGQTTPYQGKTYKEYKCCPKPTACSPSKCTSPNGEGGHDCWAGNGEAYSCAPGYSSKMTGQKAPYNGKDFYEYTCCKVGGSPKKPNSNDQNKNCVAKACREYSKERVDNDCCGVIGQTFCDDGFTLQFKKNDKTCEKNSPRHRGTCCIKNGQKHKQNFKNKKSKCRSHGKVDENCCAFQGGGSCADGFKLTTSQKVCFSYQQYKAYSYTCTNQGTMSGQKSDPKKCREHGRFDNDCCALKGTNTCADHYTLEQTEKVCYKNTQFTAYTYHCLKPDIAVVHG